MARCCRFAHPSLPRPVGYQVLTDELEGLVSRVPGLVEPGLAFSAELGRTHRREPRRYAQVWLKAGLIEVAPAILWLPREHRVGLLAHELGHVLAPDGSEDDADAAARAELGVAIAYDRRWPGKGLQFAYA